VGVKERLETMQQLENGKVKGWGMMDERDTSASLVWVMDLCSNSRGKIKGYKKPIGMP
jgi:hypothetical protein